MYAYPSHASGAPEPEPEPEPMERFGFGEAASGRSRLRGGTSRVRDPLGRSRFRGR